MFRSIFAICLAGFSMIALGQNQEQKAKASNTPCVFDVKPQSSKGVQEGSYTRTKSKSLSYKAFVRSNAKESVDFSLETIYMALSMKDRRQVPFSRDEFFFTLEPGESTNIVFQTPMLESTEYTRWSGSNLNRGFKILGTVARLKRDGVVVKNYCSNKTTTWQKIAWSPSVEVESESSSSEDISYQDSEQLRISRLASSEHVDLSRTRSDVAPAFFKAERMSDPVRFRAKAHLYDTYYDDFYVWRKSHICVRLLARGESNSFYFYGYARKGEATAQKAAELLGDGEEHEVWATLHYPRKATSSSACFLDDLEEYKPEMDNRAPSSSENASSDPDDISIIFFKAERITKPTTFAAEIALSPEFYGSSRNRETHWCIEVKISERKTSRTISTTVYALLRKDSPAGTRIIKMLKDGEFHKGQAVLRYHEPSEDSSSADCLIEDFVPDGGNLGGSSVL